MLNSLLVICTGNICRSPMAEALFSARAKAVQKSLFVASAGVAALVGFPPPDEVVELMVDKGLDVSGHRAQQATLSMAQKFDLILVMENEQKFYMEAKWPALRGRIHRLCEKQNQDVIDPYRCPKKVYMKSLDQIEAGLEEWSKILFR